MVPHVWITLDLDDLFNIHAFIDKATAIKYLNDHGYFEKRPSVFADKFGRYATIKEVILHEH